MDREEMKDIAARILAELCEDPEFCLVYEDEECEELSEEDQLKILNLLKTAVIRVSWDDD